MKLITVHQAATLLDLSEDTIRRWEKKGLIKAVRDSRNYRCFIEGELLLLKKQISNQEINAFKILRHSKMTDYTVMDLFSGAGGTSLGFENAGLQHVGLVEYDKFAVETLRMNRSEWNIHHVDVREMQYKRGMADIVEGGFPCQAFSSAGKKMGFNDVRGTMFFEFARAVKEIRPKVAVGENVKGLLQHDEGRTFRVMIDVLSDLGYRVAFRLLKAQYYDVPQKRERLVIVAVDKKRDIPILFPKTKGYVVTLREALKECPSSPGVSYPEKKKRILTLIPPGGYWRDLPEDLRKEYMGASYYLGGGKTGMARRLHWDEPSLTLTCSPAQKQTERCHPAETRPLTVREYARIQTFPDDWQFSGSVAQQYKQIGNAVPVNLGYHIGSAVRNMLDGTWGDEYEHVSLGNNETYYQDTLLTST